MKAPPTAEQLGVSRETHERLLVYVDQLTRWQRATNLVSQATLDDVWQRHVRDSLQLLRLIGERVVADLGSGAGLPGLILALARPSGIVHLIESDARKCAFLREVVRQTGAPARIHHGRIESRLPALDPAPRIVVARALAPLSTLLDYAAQPLGNGANGVFLKGKAWETELTDARKAWRFTIEIHQSQTDPMSRILCVGDLRPAAES